MTTDRQRRRLSVRAAVGATALLATTASLIPLALLGPSPAAAQSAPLLREIGKLPVPDSHFRGSILGFNADAREMYYLYRTSTVPFTTNLAVYDTGPAVPQVKSTRFLYTGQPPQDLSPYTAFYDRRRARVCLLAPTTQSPPVLGATGMTDSNVRCIPIASGGTVQNFPLTHGKLPGFIASGLNYSYEDDRIYVLGEFRGQQVTDFVDGRRPAGLAAVTALDPATGDVIWVRTVPECQHVMRQFFVGSLLAYGGRPTSPTLLFACYTGSASGQDTYPGQAGLAALSITPTASRADAPLFPMRYYPVSGAYATVANTGVGVFDPVTDRFFVLSMSFRGHGAWVFDLRRRGWVGFISSANPIADRAGFNEVTGNLYVGGNGSGKPENASLLVADGRATPPQSGSFVDKKYSPDNFIVTEPASRRTFIPTTTGMFVMEDRGNSVGDLPKDDPDRLTDDVAETPDTFVTFTGDAAGFGSRIAFVGGTSGALSATGQTLPKDAAGGTRGAAFARSPGLTVQPPGVTALAQTVTADSTTVTDFWNTQQPRRPPSSSDLPGGLKALDDPAVVGAGDKLYNAQQDLPKTAWPYQTASCQDGGTGVLPDTKESPGGKAVVTCAHAASQATAETTAHAVAGDEVKIADSRFLSTVRRTSTSGVRATTTASAKGVEVAIPGVGSVSIAEVSVEAQTVAHGRKGTATAKWTRRVSGVVVRDATGRVPAEAKELLGSGGCVSTVIHDGRTGTPSGNARSCDALADAVQKLLQVRLRLSFPTPDVKATPKGAFGQVAQDEDEYYNELTVNGQGAVFADDSGTRRPVPGMQIDVYNDSAEKSRVVVQLAGVELSSSYYVSTSLGEAPCDTSVCIPGGGDVGSVSDIASGDIGDQLVAALGTDVYDDLTAAASGPVSTRAAVSDSGGGRRPGRSSGGALGWVVMRRGVAQGVLTMATTLLFGAAGASVVRRRRLLASLQA